MKLLLIVKMMALTYALSGESLIRTDLLNVLWLTMLMMVLFFLHWATFASVQKMGYRINGNKQKSGKHNSCSFSFVFYIIFASNSLSGFKNMEVVNE